MKRQLVTLTIALLGTLSQLTGAGAATTMSDYTALPPFIADSVVPNVLLALDKSGSMGRRADCNVGSGAFANFNACPTFVETQTYSGLFDPLKCYTYDAAVGNTRFNVTTNTPVTKATISTSCNTLDWDGNFLNWITLRRIDAFKLAWIGGSCAVTRNPDGTCPTTGSPAKITLKGVDKDVFNSGDTMVTPAIPTTVAGLPVPNGAIGRMPSAVISTFPLNTNLRIQLIGNNNGSAGSFPTVPLIGAFCVDDDNTPPRETNANCTGTQVGGAADGGTIHAQPFRVRVSVAAQTTGVVQEVGEKVRFGLTEFLGNDGGYVMVPIGGRQVKPWNQPTAAVTTYDTNTAAIVHAIEATNNEGNTPLGEMLYESLRYIAQVDSSFGTPSYRHPFGFTPALTLGTNGKGSLGTGEIKVLSGSEVCPTNLPAPYTAQASGYNVTDACGRDPFFYGSEHAVSQPTGWAVQSQIVLCCKTFIIVSTDGEPTEDLTVPAAIRNFASAISGTVCTGGNATIHAPNGTCNTNPNTPPATLMGEHKTDYSGFGTHYLNDVAYWGHIKDLRQATLPDIGGAGHDFPGKQNVTIYSFFTFGNIAGRELLMHTAQQGGFEDKNGNDIPDNGLSPAGPCVTGGPCEWDTVTNATGAAAPDGIPDTFFESSDASEIKNKLTQTFTSILQRTSAGTSLSVLATSSTGEGALYQSYFYPEYVDPVLTASVSWVGFTHGLFVDTFGNIREDTTNDGGLNYMTDRILKTHFDSASNKLLLDYYTDTDGNGLPDDRNLDGVITTADCFPCNQPLSALTPMWEAGKRLALTAPANRRILTWVDSALPVWNGVVDGGTDNGVHSNLAAGEVISFEQSNCTALKDYLQAPTDTCSATGTPAENIINYIRGTAVTGMRNRQVTVAGGPQTWKLGDPIHSTPTEVGPPRERYDVIYGDAGYSKFYQKWRDRRRVIYFGANDGMLHAVNGGFYHRGDNPATTGSTEVEHGWFNTTAVSGTRGDYLGDELWGFIPMQLLPHLKWLTQADYTHVYYVDLKPKITEARIFTEEAICATDHLNAACKHPGGWGTILIGGLRMGGSCGNCQVGKGAPPMTVSIGGTNRDFYSAYFVLDITDPENDPKLLWTFSSAGFGLTTGYPAVLRVNPAADAKTSSTNEKWFMVVGSGPNSYTADFAAAGAQTPTIFAMNLKDGPGAANVNVKTYLAESANPAWKGFMGEVITFDRDLDFRVDAAYFGSVIHDGALPWRGKLYRLTMGATAPFGAQTDPALWGAAGQLPTVLVNLLPAPPPPPASPPQPELGPISSAPGITLDDANKVWVFAGTGRYFSMADKTDSATQYFIGVKDAVMDGTTPACAQTNACALADDLLDVSAVTVCQVGVGGCTQASQVTGLASPTSFQNGATSIVGQVQSKEGWYTTLVRTRERVIANPIVLGGVVFFPSFVPDNDVCSTSGDSYLFALFYKSGSAYQDPVIGATAGINNKSVYLDRGVSSSVAIHIGSQGPGGNPSAVQGCIQASSAAISCISMSPPGSVSSRYITWSRQRD